MRCLDCEYPIHDIASRACPECGRRFDPSDSTTFVKDEASAGVQRWAWRAVWVIATSPVLAGLLAVALYLLAWVMLGSRPRPTLDDPKDIPVVGWFAGVALLLLILSKMASLILLTALTPCVLLDRKSPIRTSQVRVRRLWVGTITSLAIFWIPAMCVPAFGEIIGWLLD